MENKIVENIKKDYEIKDEKNINKLKKLDRKAKLPSIIFGYTFGIIGALTLGFGMSIIMGSIFSDYLILGYSLGILGLLLVAINYPIYKAIYNRGKNKYRNEILELSNTILESK